MFEAMLLFDCAGSFIHSFFVGADFGFDDSHFVGVVKPTFNAIKSDGVDAVVHHDVVILDVRSSALLNAPFLPESHCDKQEGRKEGEPQSEIPLP